MKLQERQFKEMRNEDQSYGEQVKNKKQKTLVNPKANKNLKNLSRFSVDELMDMDEDEFDQY
jgi:hypothetical protein